MNSDAPHAPQCTVQCWNLEQDQIIPVDSVAFSAIFVLLLQTPERRLALLALMDTNWIVVLVYAQQKASI